MARTQQSEQDEVELALNGYDEEETSDETTRPLLGSGAFTSGVLLLTGFGFVAFGAALRFAEHVAWPLVEIRSTLQAEGATPFVVALTGFFAFGFGLVHRAARRPHVHVAPSTASDDGPDLELLTTELAGGFHRLQDTVEALGRRLTGIGEEQRALHETTHSLCQSNEESVDANDSVFRLAAGLDKLHAQVDSRVCGLVEKNAEGLAQLGGTLEGVTRELGDLQAAVSTLKGAVQALPVQIHSHGAAFGPSESPRETPVQEPTPVPQTEQAAPEIHDIYATSSPVESPAPTNDGTQIDTDRMVAEGLGALEQLEGGDTPETTEEAPANPEFQAIVDEVSQDAATSAAPPFSAAVDVEEPPAAMPAPSQQPEASREDTLESLLPEDALRDALEGRG